MEGPSLVHKKDKLAVLELGDSWRLFSVIGMWRSGVLVGNIL